MNLGLKNKTALVLGGGGGLGRAIAESLAREGANIAVAGIGADSITAAQSALTAIGIKNLGFVEDNPSRWTDDLNILGTSADLPD